MHRPDLEAAPPDAIRARQLARMRDLLGQILPENGFYARKLGASPSLDSWQDFERLPFTTKAELQADQEESPPLGRVASHGFERYAVFHQTSGTKGRPLAVLDTRESWDWWAECWQYVYAAAGVTPRDRIFFAFSFGPFIGFWSAHAGARRLGALTIPGGGLDSKARLGMLQATRATVLLSTVTYALRLAEVAREEGVVLRDLGIRTTLHAGEPGASIPSVRDRVEEAWGARCFDHAGATEIGAYAYSCEERSGLHLNEAEFVAEVLDPATLRPVAEGQTGELVMTNLGRAGWPVIRYRTGDLATLGRRDCPCGRSFRLLPGGIVGRSDDLMLIRGVNVYPSSIEAVVRGFDVAEFRILRWRRRAMEELSLEIEAAPAVAPALAARLHERLGIRIDVRVAEPGSLPRFELKARRVVDRRDDAATPEA